MVPKLSNLLHRMMPNPNTNSLMAILNGAFRQSKPNAAGFKIVCIGVDRLPVSILNIDPLSSKSW